MANEQISGYLAIQGLACVTELDVRIAQMTLDAVLSLEHQRHDNLDLLAYFLGNEKQSAQLLAALYASLDSLAEKYPLDSLAIYALVTAKTSRKLIKVANFGTPQAPELAWNQNHIAVHVAQSAWALVINDVTLWQDVHQQKSVVDPRVLSQMCLPICTLTGDVVGIVYAECFKKEGFSCALQAWLVALALSTYNTLIQLPWHGVTVLLSES